MDRVLILCPLLLEARALRSALGAGAEIHVIGVRGVKLPAHTQGAHGAILAGLGGGLEPGLQCGDVVIDADMWPGLDIQGIRRGKIISSTTVVANPLRKAEMHRRTGALVVDMESDVVRAWAARAGLRLAIVRGVMDTAGQEIDPALLGLVDEFGKIKMAAVARALVSGKLGQLRQLARKSMRTAQAVGQTVRALVEGV